MPAIQNLGARISALLDRVTDWAAPRRERLRRFGLVAAMAIFLVGLALALRGTPELHLTLQFGPLILLLLLSAPAGTVLNTIELYALGRLSGGPMSWRTSAELTVYTSAANMLPLPGGIVTKLAGMKAHGVSYSTASTVLLLSFIIWGGLAFLYAAAALVALGEGGLAAASAVVGAALLVFGIAGCKRFNRWNWVALVVAVRLASLLLEATRYVLAVGLVGSSVSFIQASTFVIGSFVGAAVVFAPHGLGVSEGATALLSSMIGLSAGIGFMAAAVTRVARLAGLALIASGFLMLGRRGHSGNHSGSD